MNGTPQISVVMPHRNRARELERVLKALSQQTLAKSQFEVIVVDDGSEGTQSARARDAVSQFQFRLAETEPHKSGNAAQARNVGLALARAPSVLFLDADCIPHRTLLADLSCLDVDSAFVGLIPTLGSSVSQQTFDFLASIAADAALAQIDDPEQLRGEALLSDARLHFTDDESGEFTQHPAPWVFAWTTGLIVATAMARAVKGFDESLPGKGSEDIVFGYELAALGARFHLLQVPPLLHIPHERNRRAEELRDREHERAFLRRYPDFAIEMLCAFDAGNMGTALSRLAFLKEVPHAALWQGRASFEVRHLEQTLLLLCDDSISQEWGCAQALTSHPGSKGRGLSTSLGVLGLAQPWQDGELDTVVVPDLRKLLPEPLICRILQEAVRVSRRTVFLKRRFRKLELPFLSEGIANTFDRPYWERTNWLSRSYYDWKLAVIGSDEESVAYEVSRCE